MNELDLLRRKLEREQAARKQAEEILEVKALELYQANESLKKLNEGLEDEIKRRTANLEASEAKYRKVIDQASDIIFSTDEEGYFTFINPKGIAAFGYHLDEIIGKRYIDFVEEAYKEELFAYYTRFKEDGIENGYFEFPIRSKDGSIHWLGQNVNRIQLENDGFYFNAVARDITLRKKAEKELEIARKALTQSEVKYRSVLENLDLGLMEVDTKGRIHRVYDKFCEMTGFSKDELLCKDAIDTLLVEEYRSVLKKQDNDRLNNKSGVYEVQIKRKDGKHIWVLISGAPFYDENGNVIGSLGIHFDITERKELEENLKIARHKAIEAQKAEQQFLANMSHEIRTPLNGIIGMTHLLKDTPIDKTQSEYINILSDSAEILKGLVSDILDISKIDSGIVEINPTDFNLSEFAQRLIRSMQHRAIEKGIQLNLDITGLNEDWVKTDMQWLNQILINLVSNAIKFTATGEVNFTIKKIKENVDSNTYYFEVQDTGIGIKKEDISRIFTSFKQANSSVRKEYGGTGLGLTISNKLVSILGGELELESKFGKGSSFFFNLILDTTDSTHENTLINDQAIKGLEKELSILVVEDNVMNQKYISSLLRKWNISYVIAENGRQAIDKFNLQHFDIIFMDLSMPVMDGYEATGIIRSLPNGDLPIIALTASTFLSKKEFALKSGMSDFLAKPFNPQELKEIIVKHLQLKTEKQKTNSNSTSIFSDQLDRNMLMDLYGDDFAYALEMFETYQEIIENELILLESLKTKFDEDGIRKQTHKMKSMYGMVGLTNLQKMSEHIEYNVESGLVENSIQEVERLIVETRKNEHLIQAEIENLKHYLS